MKPNRVHCFFEQSGTFKNEFIKLGIPAEDYDIQNNYGQTDHIIDLFKEIEKAYDNQSSIFDQIGRGDLIMAFFPCTYFCAINTLNFSLISKFYETMTTKEKIKQILERAEKRNLNYQTLVKLFAVAIDRDLKLIVENPYSTQSYLYNNFLMPPTLIDYNRRLRGDYFKKPTQYWFVGFEPKYGQSYESPKMKKTVQCVGRGSALEASNTRSMINSDYARNFICDFILGKPQPELTQLQLFD